MTKIFFMDNSKLKIHFGYIVGILLLVIISLIVSKFGNNNELLNYISFAATITSIFLAVISIIYAFYSNFSQSNVLGKMDVASETLNTASKDVKQSTDILSSELQKLQDIVKDIPDSIKTISSKIDITNEMMLKNNSSSENSENDVNNLGKKIDFKSFYQKYSVMGLIGLYIACLCNEKKKGFDFNKADIPSFNPNNNEGVKIIYYMYGAFITFSSLNLLSFKFNLVSNNRFVFKLKYLNKCIKIEDIRQILYKKSDETIKKNIIKKIEEYFN